MPQHSPGQAIANGAIARLTPLLPQPPSNFENVECVLSGMEIGIATGELTALLNKLPAPGSPMEDQTFTINAYQIRMLVAMLHEFIRVGAEPGPQGT